MAKMKRNVLIKQLDNLFCEYEYFKEKSGLCAYETNINLTYIYDLIDNYNIPVRSFLSIVSFLQNKWENNQDEKTRNILHKYLLSNIEKEPQIFITREEVLIPFDVIERICRMNDNKITPQCWSNNYFLTLRKSFYVDTKLLKEEAYKYFNTTKFFEKLFVRYNSRLTTTKYYMELEKQMSDNMKKIFSYEKNNKYTDSYILNFLTKYENTHSFLFNELQKKAIINCIQNQAHVICGFPGTGKSTIFDAVKGFFYQENSKFNISCIAPTGLAIKNLIKKCPVKNPEICGTIHRMVYNIYNFIENNDENDENTMDEDNINYQLNSNTNMTPIQRFHLKRLLKILRFSKLKPDLIVVDEFSMVDMLTLKHLINACVRFNCKLIIMGDENQLPPVGPGNALYQITHYKEMDIHVTFLIDIMRQDNMLLVDNIKRIKEGEYLLKNQHFDNKCMFMYDYGSLLSEKKEIVYTKLVDFIKLNNLSLGKTQFLTPENNKNCGCNTLNNLLQQFYNPVSKENVIPSSSFRLKDLLVRTKNCPIDEKGIFANGDIGKIKQFGNSKDPKKPTIVVEYDNGDIQEVTIAELHEDFALRYCLTIHKSQGGEYDEIVLFMGTPHEVSSWRQTNSKKLLYTAISRAKSRCFIIAKENLLNISQTIDEAIPISEFLK
jgi:Fe-S cluster assembly ATPase SufC